jgi:putative ABC transport system substrate-binding protein
MRRRQFIAGLGGAMAWPLAGRAQQPPMPLVGFLNIRSPGDSPHLVAAFHQGLRESGYVEGQNVALEYRWAEGQSNRLPALAVDLVGRHVAVIFASGNVTARAAQAATAAIPIVFISSIDPVDLGFVTSLNRPGRNMTGVSQLTTGLVAKQLEILHQVASNATVVAVLVNSTNQNAQALVRESQLAARMLGWQILVLTASSESDFDAAFASLVQQKYRALLIGEDAFFTGQSAKLAALATRHAVPAMFVYREFAAAGGLMTYGTSITDAYRQCGIYTGRIFKGANPADLPVMQPTKFELVLNLRTAKALGLTVPDKLLAFADEVIE